MSLKDTVGALRELLATLSCDLEKAVGGNRTAAQRVRTKSIQFAKVAKAFRKESIAAERGGGKKKKKGALRKKRSH